jgi:Tfp pilus assembly protein PilV
MKRIHTRGFGLIEVIIAAAIIVVGILALIQGYTIYVSYAVANSHIVQSAYLAEEGLEVMTLFRDNGWTANISPLSTTTTYFLVFNGSKWATTTTPGYVDEVFERTINLQDVFRESDGSIVESGGTYDPNTRKVTVAISHRQGSGTTTKSMSTYISNINSD